MNLVLCIPVYNDWQSALVLFERLDSVASSLPHSVDVLFVDDASSDPIPTALTKSPRAIGEVKMLRLRRNLGHQRAIAIALTHLYVSSQHDAIVIMDGDGEDDPTDIPALVERSEGKGNAVVVFAQRAKRSEGRLFRLGYLGFKAMHFLLVGHKVEVGNFSVVPREALARLVCVSALWNHYAAAVYHARLPVDLVPTARAPRIAGQTKMNLVALVMHGLSAISVYSDIIGVRLLAIIAAGVATTLAAIGAVVAVRLLTPLAIPGWATSAVGFLLVSLLNLTTMSMFMVLFTLRSRSDYAFLPLRDYNHFVLEERLLLSTES